MRAIPLILMLLAGCDHTPTCDQAKVPDRVEGRSPFHFQGAVPRNLLMISIDTTRKDHLGAYGDLGLTPFLDQWARDGVVMDDHVQCANWTQPGGACTMHGRLTTEIGHVPRLIEKNTPIPEGSPTLATVLEEQGYYTALVTGNAFMSPKWGTATGYRQWDTGGNGIVIGDEGLSFLAAAVEQGEADAGWFLHLHFMEPHDPYRPAEQFKVGLDGLEPWPWDLTTEEGLKRFKREWEDFDEDEQALGLKWMKGLYQAEVRMVDAAVEHAVDNLEQAGLLDDVLVVVWTDHGEQFYEHGFLTHAHELNAEENDGALWLWAENLESGRFDGPTMSIDVTPTLLDLLDIPIPDEMTGVPIGFANEHRVRMAETVARNGVLQSAMLDGQKLTYSWFGPAHFYDRNLDPTELTDLYAPGDPEVQRLWCSICEHRSVLDGLIPRSPRSDPRGLVCP